jgi:SAM-dependent methyltransferase
MQEQVKKISVVRSILRQIYRVWFYKLKPFPGSQNYWIQRYDSGGNSGAGSFNQLAEFKAEIINNFVKEQDLTTVIEYGCGDGNQLRLADYPSYIGFDVSPKAIALCKEIFRNDTTKSFRLIKEYHGETAQLTLSLDVIYHLIEDDTYNAYMHRLFNSSERFVVIYSSNYDEYQKYHEKHRQFTRWVDFNKPDWKLINRIPNRFPYCGDNDEGSRSDFYIYENFL